MGARTGNYATSSAMDEMLTAPVRSPEVISLPEPVGDAIAHALAEIGVSAVFGVISIHNMPILDAIARHNRIRFVPARSEAGAMNMADAYARKGDSGNEFAIYDSVLQELALQAQNLPLGSAAEGQRSINDYSPVATNTAETEAESEGEEQEAGAPEVNAGPQRRTNPAFQVNTPAACGC